MRANIASAGSGSGSETRVSNFNSTKKSAALRIADQIRKVEAATLVMNLMLAGTFAAL